MRAWTLSDGTLSAAEIAAPEPTADQVVVEVHSAVVPAEGTGVVAGGACRGTVVACGDNATHLAGKAVLVGALEPCGECDRCRRGAVAQCADRAILGVTRDGVLAERAAVSARWACPLDDGLAELTSPESALIASELALAYAMFARAGTGPGDPVIVAGDGLVNRLLADVALARGLAPAVVTGDPGYAAELTAGGGYPLDPSASLIEQGRAAASAAQLGAKPWRVFDGDGEDRARAHALELAEPAAMIVARGGGSWTADLGELLARDVALLGVSHAHPDLLTELAALVVRGELDLGKRTVVLGTEALGDGSALEAQSHGRAVVVDMRR